MYNLALSGMAHIYITLCMQVCEHYIIIQHKTVIGGNVTFGELLYEDNIVTGHRRRSFQTT